MRLVSYQGRRGVRTAVLREGQPIDLQDHAAHLPSDMPSLIQVWDQVRDTVQAVQETGRVLQEEYRLVAPIPNPRKVICVGLNYADHARETGAAPPPEPVIFSKFVTAITGPEAPILLPRESQCVDYEAELVVVVGRPGRRIAESQAMGSVFGYMCGNDVSARDWQMKKPGGQWLLGKSFDTFAPVGPHLVTADEVPDPHNLSVRLLLNGQVMQQSNTNQFIFSIPRVLAYVSQVCTLEVGDLVFTGTPGGVGFARKPPVFLRSGDVVEVQVENVGQLRNPVVADES